MVSIRDVARHAGVSIGTASNVLNQPEHVKPANIARVHASMRELGFVRNDLARQLRVGTGTTIGLIVLNPTNPLFADLAQELKEVAEADGKTIVVGSSAQVASREDRYIDMFVEQRVRGLLIAPLHGVSAKIKPSPRARGAHGPLRQFRGSSAVLLRHSRWRGGWSSRGQPSDRDRAPTNPLCRRSARSCDRAIGGCEAGPCRM